MFCLHIGATEPDKMIFTFLVITIDLSEFLTQRLPEPYSVAIVNNCFAY